MHYNKGSNVRVWSMLQEQIMSYTNIKPNRLTELVKLVINHRKIASRKISALPATSTKLERDVL